MFLSLREFIEFLEQKGDLVRVKEEISTHLELTELHKQVLHKNGPALLVENATTQNGPSHMPVFVNLFGSKRRIAWGLGIEEEGLRELGQTLSFLRTPTPPKKLKEAVKYLPLLRRIIAAKPKTVNNAPCQEVVYEGDDVNLNILPIQHCWPKDVSPLITWPLIVTKGPSETAEDNYNLGIYRLQLVNKNTLIMRWLKHRGGAQHHKRWGKEKNTKLPVAAVIGADPALTLAATMPIPDNVSEYDFSGLLRGKKLPLVKAKTVPLLVPANAEIIIEGYVSIDEYMDEGPFGDHTGYYNSVEKFPVFQVTAITMRKDPIYLSTYTGHPPDEPSVLGEALNEVFIPLIQQQFPEIVDFWLPPEGCSYRIAVISIKKSYPGHAKRIMMGAWSYLRQFIYTKIVIVVDEDINCRDWKEVMWAISTRMDPVKDIVTIENTPIDYLDFASPESGLGGKLGLDATNKIYPETNREWGEEIEMDAEIEQKIAELMKNIFK
ncbi:MAG: UbiD family decarboxylase [Sphingobacteriia bacterium]|nr:UbiD family decarboxylase [Sphingobacteriia bacterium]